MRHRRIDIPLTSPVSSLCWSGESLIDWAGRNRVFDVPSGERGRDFGRTYRFDAAVQSASGRFAAIYERFGTKAVLFDGGKPIRELNRSFYHADSYEYPLVFLTHPDGRELIAHCPEAYNRIEMDDVLTGERLTERANRKPDDVFHSRLAVSSDNSRLLSAGWIWHPVNTVSTWSVAAAIADATVLDSLGPPSGTTGTEINDTVFVDADRLLLSANPDAEELWEEGAPIRPGSLGVFDLRTNSVESLAKIEQTVGAMLWLGDDRVVGFHETPRVINVRTGAVECGWPDLHTGKRSGSITGHVGPLPPLAIDQARRRFAVASDSQITVIEFL